MKRKCLMIVAIMIFIIGVLWIQSEVNAADSEGNLVIILDPGHGGSDPGAVNNNLGLQEAKVNYKIALYAKEELEKYEGVKVYLTRYANCPSIYDRGEFAKNYNADLVISIHINSGSSSARGAEIWVTQDNTKIEYYQKSREVGEKILNQLSGLGIKNNGVSTRSGRANEWYPSGVVKDYYGIIRYPMNYEIRSLLVEHCYISNYSDCQYINSDEKLRRLGVADATGIAQAYHLTKKWEGKKSVKQLALDKSEINLEITADDPQPLNFLYPVFTPSDAYNKNVEYYSSNPDVVRVWGERIRGLKEGEATITAISDNNQRIAKCKVVVTKPSVPLKQITIDPSKMVLNLNQREKINVSFNPSNCNDQTLYWKSSNPDIVRVWDGYVRGLKEGTSMITATSRAGGKTVQCEVIVRDPNKVYVENIKIEKTNYTVDINDAIDITDYTYTPKNAMNAEFEWTSSNPDILRVWGPRFRALKKGTAYVIVKTKDGTVENKIKVTINDPGKVQDMTFEPAQYTIDINDAIDITDYTYTPKNATNAEFEWSSSNPDVLRVWGPRFRGLKKGTAYVIVRTTDGSFEKRIKVTINDPGKVKDMTFQQNQYIININEAIDITGYTYTPKKATNAEFEWSSSNPEILRVWGPRFRGLKEGMAKVVVKTLDGSFEKTIDVIIRDKNKKYVKEITLEQTEYTVKEDEVVDKIKYNFTPKNAANAQFVWESTDPSIVRVWGNRFRGLKKGTAQVIVRTEDGTVEKRINVTVTK